MRVLRTEGSDKEGWIPRLCTHRNGPYAILSHRWADDPNHEVLFADIEEVDELHFGQGTDEYNAVIKNAQYVGIHPEYKPAYRKVRGAARQALKDGYQYVWIDSCCIDKNSSSELSEAINSMWMWYKQSNVCYVYLIDVIQSTLTEFEKSTWWTRGWTLQELLAPQELTFFTSEWNVIGPKKHMDLTIANITKIDSNVVNGTIPLESVSIGQRMSWASTRTTTRIEDMAYCLLGIFGVSMPLLYGEGENAFIRLQQEIIKDSEDETIFAWRDESITSGTLHGLLARTPLAFTTSYSAIKYRDTEARSPYTITNKGLAITLDIAHLEGELYTAGLHCPNPENRHRYANIFLEKLSAANDQYARVRCGEWAPAASHQNGIKKMVYVRQRHDQRPAYTALDLHSAGRIRLLRVLPAEDPAVIKLELVEVDVETSRYSIVSHVWDRSSDSRTVWVNSEPQRISQNLFDFLRTAQQQRDGRLFWVDYICIQQINSIERKYALNIWTKICAYAQGCVIWLGDLSNNAISPPRPHPIPQSGPSLYSEAFYLRFAAKHALVLSIARHSYWQRAWVIQEPFLADRVSVEFIHEKAAETLPLTDLDHMHYLAFRENRPVISETMFMYQILELIRKKPKHATTNDSDLLNRKPAPYIPQIDFEELITKFQYQESVDRRDRIYALIAISNLSKTFKLDYTLSVTQVFYQVARSLGDKLTLTILPKLMQALEIVNIPTEQQCIDESHNEGPKFMIHHVFHHWGRRVTIISGEPSDNSSGSSNPFFTLENKGRVPGGLMFGQGLDTTGNLQTMYFPRCLYRSPNGLYYRFLAVPAPLRDALANTSAFNEATTNSRSEFLIKTDGQGLLALGLCMQSSTGGLPKIFDAISVDTPLE